jgi:predicted RNase H-like HicB family nuclease
MAETALFINGIFDSVLEEILEAQSQSPDVVCLLQPYDGRPMRKFQDDPPTPEAPVILFASTTSDLQNVSYTAEIIGWEDKTQMTNPRRAVLNALIKSYQPKEGELYDYSGAPGKPSLNLLHVRGLVKVDKPFTVAKLVKDNDRKPLSTNRSRSGGWSYVVEPDGFATSNPSGWMEGLGMTIELEQEVDGRWIAEVEDLPGVMVYGDSPRDAKTKVVILALRVLADRIEHGETEVDKLDGLFQTA